MNRAELAEKWLAKAENDLRRLRSDLTIHSVTARCPYKMEIYQEYIDRYSRTVALVEYKGRTVNLGQVVQGGLALRQVLQSRADMRADQGG